MGQLPKNLACPSRIPALGRSPQNQNIGAHQRAAQLPHKHKTGQRPSGAKRRQAEHQGLWKQHSTQTKPHGARLKPGVLSCVRANRGSSPRRDWARRKACLLSNFRTRPGGTQQCGLLWNHFERLEYRLSQASSCFSPDNLMDDPSIPSWVVFLFPNKQTGLAGIHSAVGEAPAARDTWAHTVMLQAYLARTRPSGLPLGRLTTSLQL